MITSPSDHTFLLLICLHALRDAHMLMLMNWVLDGDWMVKRTRSQSGDWRVRLSFPTENRSDKRERERREAGGSANGHPIIEILLLYFKISMRYYTDCVQWVKLYRSICSRSHIFERIVEQGREDSPGKITNLPSDKSCLVYQFSGRWFLPRKLSFTGRIIKTLTFLEISIY